MERVCIMLTLNADFKSFYGLAKSLGLTSAYRVMTTECFIFQLSNHGLENNRKTKSEPKVHLLGKKISY